MFDQEINQIKFHVTSKIIVFQLFRLLIRYEIKYTVRRFVEQAKLYQTVYDSI